MIKLVIFLIVVIDLAICQLNFEGNPLTEDTEYTAEETRLSEKRTTRIDDSGIDLSTSGVILSRPQKLYPVFDLKDKYSQPLAETNNVSSDKSQESIQHSLLPSSSLQLKSEDTSAGRQFPSSYDQNSPINPMEIALSTFLNSRTPEESRASLDHYLHNQAISENHSRSSDVTNSHNKKSIEIDNQRQSLQQVSQIIAQQQSLLPQMDQQMQVMPQVDQGQLGSQLMPPMEQSQLGSQLMPPMEQSQLGSQLMPPMEQSQLGSQLMPQVDQRQQLLPPAAENYGYVNQVMVPAAIQPVIRAPLGVTRQETLQPMPLVPGLQARNDIVMPAMWWQRMRRTRGKPFPFAQSRITPAIYKAPIAVPLKHKVAPVEVIYTKPPGILQRGPPILSNPPVPYEDTGAWLPDASYPPSSKDIYYSQLYTQSYDPHYYNYIGATGKIRPHLYGKLGKRQEEQDDGIWMELYRGFKKHGLKNLMTPTFLLGMTLPVVTLMLSALVQKRSINRSDARRLDQEDALREYLEQLQSAMECYSDRNSWNSKLYKC